MQDTNPYSSPNPTVDSPDLVIERKRMPLIIGFLGADFFVMVWLVGHFGFIAIGDASVFTSVFVWGFTFPISLLCLYFIATKPPPVFVLEGDQLRIRKTLISSTLSLSASGIQYFAYESAGELDVLVIALPEADEVLKRKRNWFWSSRPNCVIVNVQESKFKADEVAEKLSDLLGVPNKGRIGQIGGNIFS